MKYSVAIVLILDVLVVNSKGLLEDNNPNIFSAAPFAWPRLKIDQ